MPRKQSAKFRIDEPIRYEELLDSSSMAGLVSFLDLPTSPSGIPKEQPAKMGIPSKAAGTSIGIPEDLAPLLGIPNEAASSKGIPMERIPGIPNERASLATPLNFPATGEEGIPIQDAATEDIAGTLESRIKDSFHNVDLSATPLAQPESIGIPIEIATTSGIPNVRYAHIIEARRLRPFRLTLVQDGHSRNEQAIYEVLWKDGRQLPGLAAKSVQIGYGELARRARVSRNSVIRLLISLEKKFSISRANTEATQAGSWYTVFDYSSILEARQRAGLLWAVRDRNGVLLLTRTDVVTPHFRTLGIPEEPSPGIPNEPSAGIPISPPRTLVMPTKGMPGIPTEPLPGIPNNGASPKYLRQVPRKDDVADLLAEIKQQTDSPPWDRSAGQNLWNSCRQRGVETVSELMYFFNLKWQMIRLKRNTVNPVGLMTKAVPESISSEALLNLRQEIDSEDEPNPETAWALNGWQDRYQAVLDDPGASEQEKRIAATALSQNKYEGRGRSAYE